MDLLITTKCSHTKSRAGRIQLPSSFTAPQIQSYCCKCWWVCGGEKKSGPSAQDGCGTKYRIKLMQERGLKEAQDFQWIWECFPHLDLFPSVLHLPLWLPSSSLPPSLPWHVELEQQSDASLRAARDIYALLHNRITVRAEWQPPTMKRLKISLKAIKTCEFLSAVAGFLFIESIFQAVYSEYFSTKAAERVQTDRWDLESLLWAVWIWILLFCSFSSVTSIAVPVALLGPLSMQTEVDWRVTCLFFVCCLPSGHPAILFMKTRSEHRRLCPHVSRVFQLHPPNSHPVVSDWNN